MIELNIIKVGLTVKSKGETVIICEGDFPPDCVVVFMERQSWEILKKELGSRPSITRIKDG